MGARHAGSQEDGREGLVDLISLPTYLLSIFSCGYFLVQLSDIVLGH